VSLCDGRENRIGTGGNRLILTTNPSTTLEPLRKLDQVSSVKEMKSDGKSALVCCFITLFFTLIALLVPEIGGYGFIPWCFHPALLNIGIFGLTPLGLLAFRIWGWGEGARLLHGALQGVSAFFSLGGYFAAWYLHEIKGHAHFPKPGKPLSRYVHIYGGLLCIILLFFQVILGVSKLSKSGNGNWFGRNLASSHSVVGFRVWVGLVVVSLSGLSMPFYEKAGNNLAASFAFVILCALNAGSVYLVSGALS